MHKLETCENNDVYKVIARIVITQRVSKRSLIKPRLHKQFLSRASDAIFFQILSRRLRARVATLVTNFGDKLKAARIAYFKTPGHYKQTFLL